MFRYAILAGGIVLAALAIVHPAPRPPASLVAPSPRATSVAVVARASRGAAVVYVAGAVRRPGLYTLDAGARADEAVRRAGGFTRDADAAGVNLAQPVADGDEVEVPVVGASPRHRSRRGAHARSRSRRPRHVGIVELNTAGEQALAAVPGVGAAIAGRIVEVREREGPFDSLDELLDVAGMNESRLERARPYLRL